MVTSLSTILWVEELILILISIRQICSPQLVWLRYGASILHMARQESTDCWVISLLKWDVGFQAHFHKVLDNTDFLFVQYFCIKGMELGTSASFSHFALQILPSSWCESWTSGGHSWQPCEHDSEPHCKKGRSVFLHFMQLTSKFSDWIQGNYTQSNLRTVSSR